MDSKLSFSKNEDYSIQQEKIAKNILFLGRNQKQSKKTYYIR